MLQAVLEQIADLTDSDFTAHALHVTWSGMTSFDLSKPRQRMGLYRTVLHEGLREDLPRYLDQDLLLQLWPVLRTLVGRSVRTVWEDAFPLLASRARAAA
jgi:hypothetical protein